MIYEDALHAIEVQHNFKVTAGLTRMENLMRLLGNPQDSLSFVHVTGTNGKGSVCAMTAAILRQSGKKVGLYTSPYLRDFRERIQINGIMISKVVFSEIAENVLNAAKKLASYGCESPNSFELTTAIAFCYFAQEKCDYVVLEVGLGGMHDATNIISTPEICCITSISLDHTSVLGNTIAEIAREKSGIIKNGSKVVIPSEMRWEALEIIESKCRETNSIVIQSGFPKIVSLTETMTKFWMEDVLFSLPLIGMHQVENAMCALRICQQLHIESDTLKQGIATVYWPGRLQILPGKPSVLIDSAHNPDGIRILVNALKYYFSDYKILTIMGMMADKDYKFCIQNIASVSYRFFAVSIDSPRSLSAALTAETAAKSCSHVFVADSLCEAICKAESLNDKHSLILFCGSVYLAGEALNYFNISTETATQNNTKG